MNGTAAQQVYRRGDAGPAVADIRDRLAGLGLLDHSGDQHDGFDDALDRAVRAFQQQRGLVVDGGRQYDDAFADLGPNRLTEVARGHIAVGDRRTATALAHQTLADSVDLGVDRVLFAGDDTTDESVFVTLRPGDVGMDARRKNDQRQGGIGRDDGRQGPSRAVCL